MKKISLLVVCLFCIFLITGCGDMSSNTTASKSSNAGKIKDIDDLTSSSGTLTCTREGTASDGVMPSFNYYITYKNDNILVLHSVEMITSDNSESLDQYEEAYKKINTYYKGLNYYDSEIKRTSDSVARDTVINYEKIDIDKLLEIEGEEDNIIKDGKAKLAMWLEFASKFGTTCSEA